MYEYKLAVPQHRSELYKKKKAFLTKEECCGTACLWRCGNNVFKGKLKKLNLVICIFTQDLNVKQVLIVIPFFYYFSFYLRFISSLVR